MPLSWNEIKSRALAFTQEWKDAEAQSFWNDFFNVFGISQAVQDAPIQFQDASFAKTL